eukprot:TRINITY_DN3995_c0_g1_i1.p1 TRINITY_DN3995_c0_g1~~TRINITY_DN3995_c0_g1_i1.p1  ORF type:complete len:162 (-),score=19.88 TRINITY_DN3995_c0_g1_i1:72-494(-)
MLKWIGTLCSPKVEATVQAQDAEAMQAGAESRSESNLFLRLLDSALDAYEDYWRTVHENEERWREAGRRAEQRRLEELRSRPPIYHNSRAHRDRDLLGSAEVLGVTGWKKRVLDHLDYASSWVLDQIDTHHAGLDGHIII